jgi:predicted MPP superfamily phosphohydrolase
MYVHRGMGTSGPPSRFGARPEIAVLVLRRAQEF